MKRIVLAVLGAALVTAGCSDPLPPVTPTPAVPTLTDTFSDTLLQRGANTHQFIVTAIGGVKVTLTSVEPGAVVGLGIGTPSFGSCSVADKVETVAGAAVQLSGTATIPGLFCVTIFDIGNLVEPAAYTINVLHS
jgi:hypothetical protein